MEHGWKSMLTDGVSVKVYLKLSERLKVFKGYSIKKGVPLVFCCGNYNSSYVCKDLKW